MHNHTDLQTAPRSDLDYGELARREREQRFLADAGEALASSLDYSATLNMVAHMAAGSIADFCVVEIADEKGRLSRLASEDVEEGPCDELCAAVDGWPEDDGNWAVATAMNDQKVVVVDVPQLPANAFGVALRSMGAKSVVIAPLRVRERSIGVLVLGYRRQDGPAIDTQLAEEVARRSAMAIENARLHAEAQRAIKARDATLAVVAHDLRNPLGVISMTAQLVKEVDEVTPQVAGRMDMIERAATRMNTLIQDLLDAARIDAGTMKLELRPDRADSVLREAAESLAPLAQKAEVELAIVADADLPLIMTDRTRLLQAIGNLAGNAFKFTPAGGSVTLSAEPSPDGVRVRIADTGVGISADDLPHLFDRFWQKKETDRRGIGLGLAIARGIVEAHGSNIEVRSELGRGTQFEFVLRGIVHE